MRSVYELDIYEIEGPIRDEARVRTERLGLFASRRDATKWFAGYLRKRIKKDAKYNVTAEPDERTTVLYYELCQIRLGGSRNSQVTTTVIAPDGTETGTIDHRLDDKHYPGDPTPRFKRGDAVALVSGERLRVGVVKGGPFTPEDVAKWQGDLPYWDGAAHLIVYNDPVHEFDHDHARAEYLIPVSRDVVPLGAWKRLD